MAGNPAVRSTFPPPPPFYRLYGGDQRFALPPPHPPPGDQYVLFGQEFSTEAITPDIEDQSEVRPLYSSKAPDFNPAQSLQDLNQRLFAKYEELLQTLVTNAPAFETQLRELRDILVNMHYLVNSYRPHQARETILCLLQDQQQRKEAAAVQLGRVLKEAHAALAEARALALAQIPAEQAVPHLQRLMDRAVDAMDTSGTAPSAPSAPS